MRIFIYLIVFSLLLSCSKSDNSSSDYSSSSNSGSSIASSSYSSSQSTGTSRVKEGDELSFNVNASGHTFFLKTTQGTGTNDQIDGVNNNGGDEGTVTWSVPIGSAGTYYYQCSIHGDMVGQIIVEQ